METVPYYPVNEFGPVMKGLVIGGLGILHVFLAQFAIGGGMLLCYFEHLAQRGRAPHARRFLDSYFKVLVLISFVAGALTGVGMWFTTIQVSPRTIGLMVDEFHWLWAIEWTFFCLEVAAGYLFYRYGSVLSNFTRIRLLLAYSVAAWFSLFWINGILSWQLTPGSWIESRNVWAGFFNPSFFPSLLFRTIVAMTIAALVACVVINTMKEPDGGNVSREIRRALIQRCAHFLAPMVLMPLLGAWYLWVIPDDSRSWILGGSPAMTLFLATAAGASVLIAGYAVMGLLRQKLYINGATATLLVALAFFATAAGEFVREGARKPYTVRDVLYSNSIGPRELARMRQIGSVTGDPYPLADHGRYPAEVLRLGARVYRFQCSVCHTIAGANGLTHLAGSWSPEQLRMNFAKLQHTKAFMPPFAGTAEEVEALAQFVMWESAGAPGSWPVTDADSSSAVQDDRRAVIERIERWLSEAGTGPGTALRYRPDVRLLDGAGRVGGEKTERANDREGGR
ncbi:MAG: cytochrome ubiquinol oxidase subunit I [Proteobacteria bacterium]|nr:cytochrome ubiquinol oxidase subunit I [Pseudomonadota bacterium]